MGNRRTFEDWLGELQEIVKDQFEISLEEMPEFDRADARSYYKERSSPSLYFRECLAEHVGSDGQRLQELLQEIE